MQYFYQFGSSHFLTKWDLGLGVKHWNYELIQYQKVKYKVMKEKAPT